MRKGIAHRIKFMSCAFFWLLKFMNKQNILYQIKYNGKQYIDTQSIREKYMYISKGQYNL